MTFPLWMLIGFALWTLIVLIFSVGVYRWSRILTGRVEIKEFRADILQGEEWYRRSMRAHANCVENLPIFIVIVMALYIGNIHALYINALCAVILISRICHSVTHIAFIQTNLVASIRFSFFLVQIICFLMLLSSIFLQLGDIEISV